MKKNSENCPDVGISNAFFRLNLRTNEGAYTSKFLVWVWNEDTLFLTFYHVFSPQSLEPVSTVDQSDGSHLQPGQAGLPIAFIFVTTNYNSGDWQH